MLIFVINLDKDVARWESVSRQLSKLGLVHERVRGVYGATLSPDERDRDYDERRAILHRSRPLVPSEIGCALSHVKVYREVLTRGLGCALVLEDDVVLPEHLGALLKDCERQLDPDTAEVWLLSPAQGRRSAEARGVVGGQYQVLRYSEGYFASSYVVTRAACDALLSELYPISDVADCWSRISRYGSVGFHVVTPALIVQNQREFGSSTTSDYWAAASVGGSRRLLYLLRRVRSVLWEAVYAPYRRCFRSRPVRGPLPTR